MFKCVKPRCLLNLIKFYMFNSPGIGHVILHNLLLNSAT